MTNEDDLGGKELYPVKLNNVRSNAMMEKAMMCRDQNKPILAQIEPQIRLTKIKSNTKAEWDNKS